MNVATQSEPPLSWRDRIVYAAPAVALAAVGIPVYVHLPKFYTDVVGLGVATVGAIIAAVRIFDAVADPLAGLVSDRLRTPWGRRRPLILGSAPLLGLALTAVGEAKNAGLSAEQIRGLLRALLKDPGNFREHEIFGALASKAANKVGSPESGAPGGSATVPAAAAAAFLAA